MRNIADSLLEINPPARVERVIYAALSASPDTAQMLTLCQMAQVYTLTGSHEEAEALYKTALVVGDAVGSKADKLVGDIKRDYANLLRRMGRSDEAEVLAAVAGSPTGKTLN